MTTLTALANLYGTDKGTSQPDHHGYTDFYESWCAPRRDEPLRILELGVFDGASLRMWADYFLHARVFGIDIEPLPQVKGFDGRVCVTQMDQADTPELVAFAQEHGPFDLIVDDAGHGNDAQLISASVLLAFMAPCGRYCVEDVLDEQPIMGLVRGEYPAQWGIATQARARDISWTVHASRYPGRSVVVGDRQT